MVTMLIAYLVTVSILSAVIYANSFNVAWSDLDFCYDQLCKSVRINKDMMK
jgi:hypothetical protein